MTRHGVEVHHRTVCQERHLVEARHRRQAWPPTHIDEDAIGAQVVLANRDFAGRSESGVSCIDLTPRQTAQHSLDPGPGSFSNPVLPDLDVLHVHANVAVNGHTEIARSSRGMSDVRAGNHGFRWYAAGVHARAAEQMPLDDRDRHPCA